MMLKSGSEFREFSLITVTFPDGRDPTVRPAIAVERHEVKRGVAPDREMDGIVQKYLNKVIPLAVSYPPSPILGHANIIIMRVP